MQNIIVPTDFSIKSYNALRIAIRIAKKTKGTIHLIHVLEPIVNRYTSMGEIAEDPMSDVFIRNLIDKLNHELTVLKRAKENPSVKIITKLSVGDPFHKIKDLANQKKADLIIIGNKGFDDPEEFFLGSLTDKVIRSISCPVLTVKEIVDEGSFKNLVYATDLKRDHVPMINLLMRMQDLFGSVIHIVKINTRNNFSNDIDSQVELETLADRFELKNYTINSYAHTDEEYGIVYFADKVDADLIAIGIHEKSGFRRLISGGSLSDDVTDHTFRPVLTYHF